MNIKRMMFQTMILIYTLSFVPNHVNAQDSQTDEIVLGMSTALTGPAQDLGRNMLAGVLAGFDRVNRNGGVNGRKIRVIVYDDGYEPKRTVPNMRKLIDEDKVLAVIGNVGTPTAIAAVPIANDKKTLLFAPLTGAGILRKEPPDRHIINFRASYAEETASMINAVIDIQGFKIEEIAFFTQRDGYGDAGFDGGIEALKKHGLQNEANVLHVRYERNTLAVENAVAEMLLMNPVPKVVIMVGVYAPCAKFIKLMKENGLEPVFLNVSFVGSESLAEHLGPDGEGVIITQVVPHYNSNLPIAKEYLKDLANSGPEDLPTFGGLEGYVAARIFILGLERIEGSSDRENIIDALESIGEHYMGMGASFLLDSEHHQASHTIWPTVIKGGQIKPFDWDDLLLGGE